MFRPAFSEVAMLRQGWQPKQSQSFDIQLDRKYTRGRLLCRSPDSFGGSSSGRASQCFSEMTLNVSFPGERLNMEVQAGF
jgi:hypothetical protein